MARPIPSSHMPPDPPHLARPPMSPHPSYGSTPHLSTARPVLLIWQVRAAASGALLNTAATSSCAEAVRDAAIEVEEKKKQVAAPAESNPPPLGSTQE
eukprot:4472835-Prymnesium_polylepis.1